MIQGRFKALLPVYHSTAYSLTRTPNQRVIGVISRLRLRPVSIHQV